MKEEREPTEGKAKRIRNAVLRIETARKITQFSFFLLFNSVVFGLGPWPILLPVIGLLGTPQKTVGDALGALQLMLYELVFPWLALASIFAAVIFLGRALCGWTCPFGFVQDLLMYVKKRQMQVSLRTHQQMINVKNLVLAAVLFVSGTLALSLVTGVGRGYKEALGVFGQAPFNVLSPADTLFAVVPRVALETRYAIPQLLEIGGEAYGVIGGAITSASPLLWVRLTIMALVIALVVYIPRGWCRYLCPQGAFSALLSRFSFLGLKREPVRCTKVGCRECVQVCPTMVPILDLPWEKFTHPECIYCLKCIDACSKKAIKPKFP